MKILVLLILVLFSDRLFAQNLTGYVFDEDTGKPIPSATVRAGLQIIITTQSGYFNLKSINAGDTITFSHISYKPYYFISSAETSQNVFIKINTTVLNSVVITGLHNYKMDSIRMRKEFSSAFNYKTPSWRDIFIAKSLNDHRGSQNIGNSFNSILSVNLLQVAALLSKNKTPISKLQKTLLKDEEDQYVARVLSKEKIASLTELKGDSLQTFINRFRPSVNAIKQMTEYELIIYIRKSYSEFLSSDKEEPYHQLRIP